MEYAEAYKKFQLLSQAKRKEYVALHKEGKTTLVAFMQELEEKAEQLKQQHVEESLKSSKSQSLRERISDLISEEEREQLSDEELKVTRNRQIDRILDVVEAEINRKAEIVNKHILALQAEMLALQDERREYREIILNIQDAEKIRAKQNDEYFKSLRKAIEQYNYSRRKTMREYETYVKETQEANRLKDVLNAKIFEFNKESRKYNRRVQDLNRREGLRD